MRAVLQRVLHASVHVDGEPVGAIGRGALVLVGVEQGDGPAEAIALATKLSGLRIFEDRQGKTNLDAAAVDGAFLVVSQFSLVAGLARGRRPSFDRAAGGGEAEPLVAQVAEELEQRGHRVAEGRFGARMQVELLNDGPLTFVLEVKDGAVR